MNDINCYKEINGYKNVKAKKTKKIYIKVDDVMFSKLMQIRLKKGISTSELVRESIRRMFEDFDTNQKTLKI